MKRYVSIVISLLLCMGLSVTAFAKGMDNFEAAKEYTGFSDVAEAAWYHGSVRPLLNTALSRAHLPPSSSLTAH